MVPNNDEVLESFINNGTKFLYLNIFLLLIFYLSFKIRPFTEVYKTADQFKQELSLSIIQEIEFLSFQNDKNLFHSRANKIKSISVYKLKEIFEETFEKMQSLSLS